MQNLCQFNECSMIYKRIMHLGHYQIRQFMFKKLSNAQLELCVKCAVCGVVVNVLLSNVY